MYRALSKTMCGVFLLAMLIGLCACGGSAKTCDWGKPIYIDKADILTDGTAREILEHNETGAKLCHWEPIA